MSFKGFPMFPLGPDDDISTEWDSPAEYDDAEDIIKDPALLLPDAREGYDEALHLLRSGNLPPPFNQLPLDVLLDAVHIDSFRMLGVGKESGQKFDLTQLFRDEIAAYVERVRRNPMERFATETNAIFTAAFDLRRQGVISADEYRRLSSVPETDEAKMPESARRYRKLMTEMINTACKAPHSKSELEAYTSGEAHVVVELVTGYLFEATDTYIAHLRSELDRRQEKKNRKAMKRTAPTESPAATPSLSIFDQVLEDYSPDASHLN